MAFLKTKKGLIFNGPFLSMPISDPAAPEKKAVDLPKDRGLIDQFDRTITYLRLSLTDQCNLRCVYCTPESEGRLPSQELLSYEELLRVVRLAVELGIVKVRLTGGEPLVRRGIAPFITQLAAVPGLADIRLTTNGLLLSKFAEPLYRAGIRKLNISLDTLRPERYRMITGVDGFHTVWEGIRQVRTFGFSPIKLNLVALRSVNDDEIPDFGKLSIEEPYQIRFIEYMPMGAASRWGREHYLPTAEIKHRLAHLGRLEPVASSGLEGPAKVYRFPGAAGTLGFISPISHRFCRNCNRLRLTAAGKLRACLLADRETDLRPLLRGGATDEEIKQVLIATTLQKAEGHRLAAGQPSNCHGQMSRIGG